MYPPSELSFEEILKFMLAHNGKVTNHDLVKHFKVFLMNPDMREEARSTFKKHVNMLAIIKNQNNEKWLILKKKYVSGSVRDKKDEYQTQESPSADLESPRAPAVIESPVEPGPASPPYRPPPPVQLNQNFNLLNSIIASAQEQTPKDICEAQSIENINFNIQAEDTRPKIHPRRKSGDSACEKRPSLSNMPVTQRLSIPNDDSSQDENKLLPLTSSRSESMLIDNEQKISVKERKQMFNRMASESDVVKTNKLSISQSVGEEDRASLDHKNENDPLDSQQKQWILSAARGEYHTLAKMCKQNAKLVKTKDPFTTAMHWACKRGDENLVKLLAGIARHIVNERSGYTPLHIAMQFHHENVYRLLVEVYDADPNVRDWSGKKPRQYLVLTDTSLSPGSFRKSDSLDLRRTITAPPTIRVGNQTMPTHSKKESFLRIGSLNVRVKKTTEAFSSFLGVGATRSSAYVTKSRELERRRSRPDETDHMKSWGSADNIQKDDKLMPPPTGKVKRRGASGRKGLASHSRSTPSTPDQPRAQMGGSEEGDSDSDSAAGFHGAWRQQRSSCT